MFTTGSFGSKISSYVCHCNHNMIIINLYKRLTHDMIDSAVNSVRKENLTSYLIAFHSHQKEHCLICGTFWLAAPGDQCPGELLSAHLPLPHTPHPPESVQATLQPCPGVHSQSQRTFRLVMWTKSASYLCYCCN